MITTSPEYIGKKGKCPKCGSACTVPVATPPTEARRDPPPAAAAPAPAATTQRHSATKGIIEYRCTCCGTFLESEGDLAGKEDTCPSCGKVTPVPLQSSVGAIAFFRKVPKWGYIGSTAIVLVVVVSLASWLALRDTWERDHGAELRQMSEATVKFIRDGKPEEGMAKYEAMRSFVGNRTLKSPDLRQALAVAEKVAEPVKERLGESRREREAQGKSNVAIAPIAPAPVIAVPIVTTPIVNTYQKRVQRDEYDAIDDDLKEKLKENKRRFEEQEGERKARWAETKAAFDRIEAKNKSNLMDLDKLHNDMERWKRENP